MNLRDFTNSDPIAQSEESSHSHPLDPLSAEDIRLARSVVQHLSELSGDICFPSIRLFDPPKQLVRDFRAGQAFERRAWVVVHDLSNRRLYDGVVSLDRREIHDW